MSLFDFLSLFYALLGVRAIWTLVKNWHAYTDDEFTSFDRQLAAQVAFFVLIPIGVFFHELGHAAATYQVGGTVNWFGGGFHYALFYGYVIPLGRFSPFQEWWIALSGNLVSVVIGFLPLAVLPLTRKAWIKYTLISFARIQLGWSLVGYPLITFAGFEGDWTTIYFTSPWLGVPVFIAQASLVLVLWRIDRSAWLKRWEIGLQAGARDQLRPLDAAVTARPGAVDPLVARGNFFAAQDQIELAAADYQAALKVDPQNPRALYNLGQMRLSRRRFSEAEKYMRGALTRAAGDPLLAGRVHYGLATCLYHRGAAPQAVAELDQAIGLLPDVPEFYYWRGTARRAARDDEGARADFARAAQLAEATNPPLAAKAREMIR